LQIIYFATRYLHVSDSKQNNETRQS